MKSSEKDAKLFEEFVRARSAKIYVKVFLCGAAFDSNLAPSELIETDIRAYLNDRLRAANPNCQVFFGEHSDLIKQYADATGRSKTDVNLALFEMQLAEYADLIVIFPSSAGSFAELGMFVTQRQWGSKLLLIQEPVHRYAKSFVRRGPVDLASKRSATVLHVSYSDKEAIYQAVQRKVNDKHEVMLSDRMFGEAQ